VNAKNKEALPRHVWWLDPGKTTGFSTLDRWTEKFEAVELDFDETCRKLLTAPQYNAEGGLVLGAESFIITVNTAKNSQAPWSLELIGCARMISNLYLQRKLEMQSPAVAKRFSSDARLKHMGYFTRAKGHANDASRHLLVFLATHGYLDEETLNLFAEMA
jgi:hypothetical protein